MDPMLLTLVLFASFTGILVSGYYAFTAKAPADPSDRRHGGRVRPAGAAHRAAPIADR